VAQSVEHPTFDFGSGHDPQGHEMEPRVSLHTQRGVCLRFFSSASPIVARTCALSLINK